MTLEPKTAFDFRCDKLPTLRFRFPIFTDWEVKRLEPRATGCTVWLRWPQGLEFETARAIYVSAVDVKSRPTVGKELVRGKTRCFDVQKNPHGVLYCRVFDAGRWVAGYKPRSGQWDYLHFYGPAQVIRIQIDGGDETQGFSTTQTVAGIAKTLRFEAPAVDSAP